MSRLIQSLDLVVVASEDALPIGISVPPSPTFPDPSTVGPASSWGSGEITTDPNTGGAYTGADARTRVPRIGGGPPGRRKGGSGNQPNKNVAQAGGGGTAYCTTIQANYLVNVVSGPDIPGFGGQTPDFVCSSCYVWTTIDAGSFPAEVAAQKAVIAGKADSLIPIVNQKASYLATAHTDDPSTTYSLTFTGAVVTTPNAMNTCDFAVANSCNDPHY